MPLDALVGTSQLPAPHVLALRKHAYLSRERLSVAALAVCAFGLPLLAQTPSEQVTGPTRPTPLPLSGIQIPADSVSVTQQTTPSGAPGSSNSLNSTISVRAPFAGSIPTGTASKDPISLTLEQALALGLRSNLGVVTQSTAVMQAEGERTVARSGLLPLLNSGITEAFERENLRTLGVSLQSIPESSKFNYIDARAARLQQTVLDIVKIDSLHSASESLKASLIAVRNTRDLIVLAVGGSYLQLISTNARVVAAKAQVETSRTIYQQAADRFNAGLAVRVDADRAQVQYQTEQQRLRSLQADLDSQKLRFSRLIGLPLGQAFLTAEDFPFVPLGPLTQDEALQRAQTGRADVEAAGASVRAAQNNVKAAHAEHLPTVNVNADFGAAGTTPSRHSTGVYTVYGTLTIPIYEGGRIRGDVEQANAALKQRQAELADAHAQVDQDVRQAFINLNAAADQVTVAQSNVSLSHETLTQSRDRFAAGVTDTVEVVQAEQAVVLADDDLISAIYEHNLAKVSLARAMGNAEQTLPQLLRK